METPYSEVKMEAINNYKPTGKLRVRKMSSLLANKYHRKFASASASHVAFRFNLCMSIRDRS